MKDVVVRRAARKERGKNEACTTHSLKGTIRTHKISTSMRPAGINDTNTFSEDSSHHILSPTSLYTMSSTVFPPAVPFLATAAAGHCYSHFHQGRLDPAIPSDGRLFFSTLKSNSLLLNTQLCGTATKESISPMQGLCKIGYNERVGVDKAFSYTVPPKERSNRNSSLMDVPHSVKERATSFNTHSEGRGENVEERAEPTCRFDQVNEEQAVYQYMNASGGAATSVVDEILSAPQDTREGKLEARTTADTECRCPSSAADSQETSTKRKSLLNASGAIPHCPSSNPRSDVSMTSRMLTIPKVQSMHLPRSFEDDISIMALQETLQECSTWSLHEAFFLNPTEEAWRVDDRVLAKCLEYIHLMSYEHPLLKIDRAARRPSMWSSSAVLPSPITPRKANLATEEQSGRVVESAEPSLYRLKHSPPVCTADSANVCPLFLSSLEAMRWLEEQEYVIGVILLCCAWAEDKRVDDDTTSPCTGSFMSSAELPFIHVGQNASRKRAVEAPRPYLTSYIHPIAWAAQHILRNFPHWGNLSVFRSTWECQVRLVLGTAAPNHQRVFSNMKEDITVCTDFEGGNLRWIECAAEPHLYHIWLDPDSGSDKRIWFRFAVMGAKEGRALRFRLLNATPHTKLYRENGMTPVWRDGGSQPHWAPVDQCSFRTSQNLTDGEVFFSIVPHSSVDTIQVAFCVPYTYADLLCYISHWHALVKNSMCCMRFEEQVLCRSPDGRKLHLLIVSSSTSHTVVPPPRLRKREASSVAHKQHYVNDEPICGPYANFSTGKKVILISGRVHPGEVTASHAVHGIISFLISSDPRAAQLREHFLFFIVPMLNPDGVSRGHNRCDQFGNNLNRCYNCPDPETQPTVCALRRVFEHLQEIFRERFIMYLDFHSHASQSSGFLFGNQLPSSVQHWNMLFPRIVELHAPREFSFSLCRFGQMHVSTKEGAARLLFGASLIHSYTVELPYFTDGVMYADTLATVNNMGPILYNNRATIMEEAGTDTHPVFALSNGKSAGGLGDGTASFNRHKMARSSVRESKRAFSEGVGWSRCRTLGGGSKTSAHTLANGRHYGFSPGVFERRGDGHCMDALMTNLPLPYQSISTPSVLSQSASVGRACMLALLDYCSVGLQLSPELTAYGGINRVLLEMKQYTKRVKKTRQLPPFVPIEVTSTNGPSFKQY